MTAAIIPAAALQPTPQPATMHILVERDTMDHLLPPTPVTPPATDIEDLPRSAPSSSVALRPSRYDANLRLIHLRRADEKKTARARPWWKPGP